MGHKVNPYGFRLGVIYPWKSNWYAGRDYAEQLHEDIWIRKHIRSRLSRAGISSIDIERKGDQIWVFIRTARPGIVIGRKGAEVDRIRKDVERYTKKRVDVKVEDMNSAASESRPETDAALLAQGVAEQLAGRVSFRRAMRRAVQTAMRVGRARRPRPVRRAPRRHGDVAARVVPRGTGAAAHAPRQDRLRPGRGQDDVRQHRCQGLGLPRRRDPGRGAGDRARPRPRALAQASSGRPPRPGDRGGRGRRAADAVDRRRWSTPRRPRPRGRKPRRPWPRRSGQTTGTEAEPSRGRRLRADRPSRVPDTDDSGGRRA